MKVPTLMLVPVDFSDPSLEALEFALSLSRLARSRLKVLVVRSSEDPAASGFEEASIRSLICDRFRSVVDCPPGRIPKDLEIATASGDPVREILRAAQDMNADLVVMGTHGRSGLARAVLGSVTERVIRRAPCPVLALRAAPRKIPAVQEA